MWPFKSKDREEQKQIKFRELEGDFVDSPDMLALTKAGWLSSRGNTCGEQGKLDEAIQDFEEAIRIKQDHLPSYFSLAIAYQKKGLTDKANKILESAPEEMKVNGEVVGTKADLFNSL